MKKFASIALAIILAASVGLAAQKRAKSEKSSKTFTGEISDSMCGLKHMMEGGAKDCTEKCVEAGSKYVLADTDHKTVYELSDQSKPKPFAGRKVKVTGTLKARTIQVESIEAAK